MIEHPRDRGLQRGAEAMLRVGLSAQDEDRVPLSSVSLSAAPVTFEHCTSTVLARIRLAPLGRTRQHAIVSECASPRLNIPRRPWLGGCTPKQKPKSPPATTAR
jgi:hypothetical protein